MEFWEKLKKKLAAPSGTVPGVKLGRNEPCWCGSGKKYKYCHYDKDLATSYRKLAATKTCSTKG